ncbi:solute carrier family 29 (equilibrative nucleoside transporter) member 1/2/3 [Clonorchis sinensis]|uniref:Solute carrier family 29 (Equilibrative nucleoside transporter) member 1/2/3 n=1 Tax=Clonorchis sinensis TaxID=79923 RepID=G7YF92_CLOSI|nr:solute carrier family 29 (equilibrative nucleoside transporter) member 1/2/3 [Clonorchis sinensis]
MDSKKESIGIRNTKNKRYATNQSNNREADHDATQITSGPARIQVRFSSMANQVTAQKLLFAQREGLPTQQRTEAVTSVVTKRLQISCQARQAAQRSPDEIPNTITPGLPVFQHITGANLGTTGNGRCACSTKRVAGVRAHQSSRETLPGGRTGPPYEVLIPHACYHICKVKNNQAILIAVCAIINNFSYQIFYLVVRKARPIKQLSHFEQANSKPPLEKALAGVLAALAQIASLAGASNFTTSAFAYFLIALAILGTSTIMTLMLRRNAHFKSYWNVETCIKVNDTKTQDTEENFLRLSELRSETVLESDQPHVTQRSSRHLLKSLYEMWIHGGCTMLTLMYTLMLFPALLQPIKSVHFSPDNAWSSVFFVPVIVFLSFNVFDWIGRTLAGFVKWNTSELTTRLLAQKGIVVAHKPNATLRKLISRPKGNQDKTKRNNVLYQINCNKFYVGQTGRKLCTRIKEHNAAVRRHDLLSLISIHEDQEGHIFNLENAKILAHGNTRHERDFLEAWYSMAGSINRQTELDPIYTPLRAKD